MMIMRFVHMRKPYALNYNQGALNPLDQFLLKSHWISHLRFVTSCSLKFDYKRRGEKNISASTFKGLKCFVINAFLNQCHSRFAKLLAFIRFAADSLQKYVDSRRDIIQTESISNCLTILKRYLQNLSAL